MSWSSRNKKKGIFYTCPKGLFSIFVFYLNVCIEYTFRIYILLHIKKYYFIHFCCLFLKSSKAFSVSLTVFFFLKISLTLNICTISIINCNYRHKFCEISKNTFFTERFRKTASVNFQISEIANNEVHI